jgi:hypothetical protein
MDHRTSKRYLTGAKGRVGSFVTDHLWLLEPSLWKEFVTALETIFSYRQSSFVSTYQIVVQEMKNQKANLRRMIEYRGATMVVYGGIYVPPIVTPCSSVFRLPPVGSTG